MIDPISLGLLFAGAALQYSDARSTAKRQNREISASLLNQTKLQREAEKKALDKAGEFETPKRQAAQAELETQITEKLAAPVSESQAIRAQQQTTQGAVSDDYVKGKAAADAKALQDAQVLARLMGKTSSANRLRMNEAIGLMDTGMDIDRLGNFARGQDAADRIAIDAAGRGDPTKQFLGSILQGAGTAGLMSGGGKVNVLDTAIANRSADPIGTLNTLKGWTGGPSSFVDSFSNKFGSWFYPR